MKASRELISTPRTVPWCLRILALFRNSVPGVCLTVIVLAVTALIKLGPARLLPNWWASSSCVVLIGVGIYGITGYMAYARRAIAVMRHGVATQCALQWIADHTDAGGMNVDKGYDVAFRYRVAGGKSKEIIVAVSALTPAWKYFVETATVPAAVDGDETTHAQPMKPKGYDSENPTTRIAEIIFYDRYDPDFAIIPSTLDTAVSFDARGNLCSKNWRALLGRFSLSLLVIIICTAFAIGFLLARG